MCSIYGGGYGSGSPWGNANPWGGFGGNSPWGYGGGYGGYGNYGWRTPRSTGTPSTGQATTPQDTAVTQQQPVMQQPTQQYPLLGNLPQQPMFTNNYGQMDRGMYGANITPPFKTGTYMDASGNPFYIGDEGFMNAQMQKVQGFQPNWQAGWSMYSPSLLPVGPTQTWYGTGQQKYGPGFGG